MNRANDLPPCRSRWLRRHGGRIWVTVLLALVLGALTRSLVGFLIIVAVATIGTIYARSRP
jgi:hypothetical protein